MFLGLIVVALSVLADQLSKFAVDVFMLEGKPWVGNDYFNLVKVWNTGVSFSMFNDYGETGRILLIIFALAVAGFLFYWMLKETKTIKIVALAMIVGGALGNVIDRIRWGAVLDFLDFHYNTLHWPAFNLADTLICIGAFILIYQELLDNKKKGLV